MFYKFNKITQTIIAATQDSSMGQFVSQTKNKVVEPMNIQYEYATQEVQAARATADIGAVKQKGPKQYPVPNNSRYRKLMDLQTKFTMQDGLLVWQKLPKDMPLYYATIIMVTAGFGLTVFSLIKLATPPKNE